jgi:hypothetical protein
MPTDDPERHHPYPTPSDSARVPSSAIATGRTPGLNAPHPTGLQPLGSDQTYDESHFGCARCLVWAIVLEAGLVIAVLLCWQLRLLPHL